MRCKKADGLLHTKRQPRKNHCHSPRQQARCETKLQGEWNGFWRRSLPIVSQVKFLLCFSLVRQKHRRTCVQGVTCNFEGNLSNFQHQFIRSPPWIFGCLGGLHLGLSFSLVLQFGDGVFGFYFGSPAADFGQCHQLSVCLAWVPFDWIWIFLALYR
jgi:hypothetical protein